MRGNLRTQSNTECESWFKDSYQKTRSVRTERLIQKKLNLFETRLVSHDCTRACSINSIACVPRKPRPGQGQLKLNSKYQEGLSCGQNLAPSGPPGGSGATLAESPRVEHHAGHPAPVPAKRGTLPILCPAKLRTLLALRSSCLSEVCL